MAASVKQVKTVDEYIATFPTDVQKILKKVRQTIRQIIPEAEETISYEIPTFKLNCKYVIYFAGWKEHISLYPVPDGPNTFNKKIAPFIKGRGTVQFPLDKLIPYALIRETVKYSKKSNQESQKRKKVVKVTNFLK